MTQDRVPAFVDDRKDVGPPREGEQPDPERRAQPDPALPRTPKTHVIRFGEAASRLKPGPPAGLAPLPGLAGQVTQLGQNQLFHGQAHGTAGAGQNEDNPPLRQSCHGA